MVSAARKRRVSITPPGRRIANSFTSCACGMNPGVFRVRVSDGVEERVVDLKGFRPQGRSAAWFGLDPTDTPLLIRDVGTADIYALTLEQK